MLSSSGTLRSVLLITPDEAKFESWMRAVPAPYGSLYAKGLRFGRQLITAFAGNLALIVSDSLLEEGRVCDQLERWLDWMKYPGPLLQHQPGLDTIGGAVFFSATHTQASLARIPQLIPELLATAA